MVSASRPPSRSGVTGLVLQPDAPLAAPFVTAVGEVVGRFLEEQARALEGMGPELAPVHRLAGELLAGGKRLRPAFCVWGYVAAAGMPDGADGEPLLRAAASLDLLHVSALVHDDVMDASDLRRGQPAAHRQFEGQHARAGWRGTPPPTAAPPRSCSATCC